MTTEKRNLWSAILGWLKLIGVVLAFLTFASCCYMLDKFRWTL